MSTILIFLIIFAIAGIVAYILVSVHYECHMCNKKLSLDEVQRLWSMTYQAKLIFCPVCAIKNENMNKFLHERHVRRRGRR